MSLISRHVKSSCLLSFVNRNMSVRSDIRLFVNAEHSWKRLKCCRFNQPTHTNRTITTASESSLVKGTDTLGLGNSIARHGAGDGCITICVGGTRFTTLRSTINECKVLADHVARAERNKEILLDGAVFIDRDPKHFVSLWGCMIYLVVLRSRYQFANASFLSTFSGLHFAVSSKSSGRHRLIEYVL